MKLAKIKLRLGASSRLLTTVREPKFRLGLAAMEVMQKLIKNEPVESRLLRADMIIRNSTAIPTVNSML